MAKDKNGSDFLNVSDLKSHMNSGGDAMSRQPDYSAYEPKKENKKRYDRGNGFQNAQKQNHPKSDSGYRNGCNNKEGSQRNGSYGGNKGCRGFREDYERKAVHVYAPYNFIPQPSKTVTYGQNASRSGLEEDLLSGRITYTVTNITPLFISDGNRESPDFYKNSEGKYAIPGSTMRGFSRSNAQVLSCSDITDDVDDYALMYRNVANGQEHERYKTVLGNAPVSVTLPNGKETSISILKNVRAGYLKNEGDGYHIYPSVQGPPVSEKFGVMNYYVISERVILDPENKAAYKYLIDKGVLGYKPRNPPFIKRYNRKGKVSYVPNGNENSKYIPTFFPVSFTARGREIRTIDEPGVLERNGYCVLSGKVSQKKAVYIIPEMSDEEETDISDKEMREAVRAFQIDYKRKENTLTPNGLPKGLPQKERKALIERYKGYFKLPENGKTRPVFYIKEGGRLYFGFTPNLRLFYDHTIAEGLVKGTASGYVHEIYGFSAPKEGRSLKSKVSFEDAVMNGNIAASRETYKVALMEPKPTDYYNYLVPGTDKYGNPVAQTYNTNGFRLRGMKQYWLHDHLNAEAPGNGNEAIYSSLRPIPAGSSFRGTIHFKNMTRAELGLLLWSMHLSDKAQYNIGQGKPYGFGRISIEIEQVEILDLKEAYSLEKLVLNPYKEQNALEYIKAYKDEFNKRLGTITVDQLPGVRALLLMKDPDAVPPKGETEYMPLSAYQEVLGSYGRAVLPYPEEVAGSHRKQ